MARVRTFNAWRYARPEVDITPLVAPPYDVISQKQRAALAEHDPHNVVHLELPLGSSEPGAADNRYVRAGAAWDSWRSIGVLSQDPLPALYVLEQRFQLGGKSLRRRALIVEVGLEPFEAGVVLPHERTLDKALGDRFELIKATAANFSQVFGLFADAAGESDALFSEVMSAEPISTAVDADGVQSILWASTAPELASRAQSLMADKQIFIADGHHRYTTALAYRDLRQASAEQTGGAEQDPAYAFVLMALVNMDDPDLVVLPYNRIADGIDFDPAAFKSALSTHFDVTELGPGHPGDVLGDVDRPAFMVKTRSDARPFVAVLKADVDPVAAIRTEHSAEWKSLDVAILQELVLWPLLGIHPDRPETMERISFTKDAHEAFRATSEHDVAFVLRPTRLSQLRAVSLAGEIMPQKSTYFYPKLLSGLVFRAAE